jgi:hypothetical protein
VCLQENPTGNQPYEASDDSIPRGDEKLYDGCSLTKGQLFTLVFAFILRHLLTDVAVYDLIALFNAVIPGCLPPTLYYFKKLMNRNFTDNIESHVCCNKCGTYMSKVENNSTSVTCSDCDLTTTCGDLVGKGSSFLVYPIEQQLKLLLETTDVKNRMMSSVASDDGGDITDITSGSEYNVLLDTVELQSLSAIST